MRIFMTFVSALVLLVATPAQVEAKRLVVKGDDVIVDRDLDLDISGVKSIEAERGVSVKIVDSSESQITLLSNSNLVEYVEIAVEGETLTATISDDIKNVLNVSVLLIIPDNGITRAFKAANSSKIYSSQTLDISSLSIEVSSSAGVNLKADVAGPCSIAASSASSVDLDATIGGVCEVTATSTSGVRLKVTSPELLVEATSASKIIAEGSVDKLVVAASSTAVFDGGDLEAKGGSLGAWSAATIKYWDSCEFEIEKGGAGSVKKVK